MICGLGNLGLRLAHEARARGERVVAIEKDPGSENGVAITEEGVKMFHTQPGAAENFNVNKREGAAQFKALQLCYHDWIVERLTDEGVHVVINKDDNIKPLIPENFFWIVDGRLAGFVLLCPGKNAPSFYTRDSKLVQTLFGHIQG